MPNIKLLIFAKHPTPGNVKTRLCPPLTADEAADIQRACIALLCERAFRSWSVRPVLMITPDDSEEAFRTVAGPYIRMLPQGDGDLGQRLERAARDAFAEGDSHVLLIGTDSPTLPHHVITDAEKQLASADVVIGPCEDGGFYLLGLRKVVDGMFDCIDWSTERAAVQTRQRAEACGLSVAELGTWYDIDRPEDVVRAIHDMKTADLRDDYALLKILENVSSKIQSRKASQSK